MLGHSIFEEVTTIVKRVLVALLSPSSGLYDMLQCDNSILSKVVEFFQAFLSTFSPLEYCTTMQLKFLFTYLDRVVQVYHLYPNFILQYLVKAKEDFPMFAVLEQLLFSNRDHYEEAGALILLLMKLPIQQVQYKIVVQCHLCGNVLGVMLISLQQTDSQFVNYCKFLVQMVSLIASTDLKFQQTLRIKEFFIRLFEECQESSKVRLLDILIATIAACDMERYAEIFESEQFQSLLEAMFFEGTISSSLQVLKFCNCIAQSTLKYRLYTDNISHSLKDLTTLPNSFLDKLRIISMLASEENYSKTVDIYSTMLTTINTPFRLCNSWYIFDSNKLFSRFIICSIELYFENAIELNRIVREICQELFKYNQQTILHPISNDSISGENSEFSKTILQLHDKAQGYKDEMFKLQLNSYGTIKSSKSKIQFIPALETGNRINSETLKFNVSCFGQFVHEIYFNARIHNMQMKDT